jgi:hypothetical protein
MQASQEAEIRRIVVQASWAEFTSPYLNQYLGAVYIQVILATRGSINRRITDQANPGIKRDPISKTINANRAGGVTQVVEHLPSKHKAPSSALNT